MADKDVATGIAVALVLTMAVTSVALAGPPAGKGRSEAKPQTPAHGAPGADKGRKVGASKGKKVRRRGSDAERSTPEKAAPPNSHAKAGKTTICHSTGSATNPYVEITISDNALPAHSRHHDGRDIIPAPAEGCETVAAQGVDEEADSEDVEGGVLGKNRTNRRSDDADRGVLGVSESNLEPETAAAPVAEEDDEGGSLPFTGLALGVLLLIAALLIAAGATTRHASGSGLD